MRYTGKLESGSNLTVENAEEQTTLTISSDGGSQQQSQAVSFTTGVWIKPPALHKAKGGPILRVTTGRGDFYFQISSSGIRDLHETPSVKEALPLKQTKKDQRAGLPPMKPMAPLAPMKPMEMNLGNMRMTMGQATSTDAENKSVAGASKRYCTQCGHAAAPSDKFCASCGHRLR